MDTNRTDTHVELTTPQYPPDDPAAQQARLEKTEALLATSQAELVELRRLVRAYLENDSDENWVALAAAVPDD